jgi:hypothetical protein
MTKHINLQVSFHNHLIAFTLLLLLGCLAETPAQWTTTGNDSSNTNSGNVGAAPATPSLFELKKSASAGRTFTLDNSLDTAGKAAGTGQFWNFAHALSSARNPGANRPRASFFMMDNLLAGNITSYTQLYSGYDTQSNVIMELGYATATANDTPLASLVLSKNLTGANKAIGVISFANSSIANGSEKRLATIGSASDGVPNSGVLVFGTALTGAIGEHMRITSGGNIGIGNSAPIYKLDLSGSTNSFRVKGVTTSVNDAIATFENSSAIQMIVRGNGNVGIGPNAIVNPTEKLVVDGNLKLTGTGNITAAGIIEGTNVKAKYQDMAEWVESSEELSGGTVVVLDTSKSNHVIASSSAYDSRVAGVISLQPGITLGEHAEGRVLVATTGRVKVKVDASNGPINIGDLLVTSDRTGIAMKSVPVEIGGVHLHRPGTLIGKALEPLAQGTGEILVLLSLQ